MAPIATSPPGARLSTGVAWRRVGAMTLLLWLVLGVCCFMLGGQWIFDRWGATLAGAFVLDLVFLAGMMIIIAVVLGWQRRLGESLRELGWRRPTRPGIVIVALVYAGLWLAMSYSNGGDPFALSWQRPIMMVIGVVLSFGEEIAVRGFIMAQLQRCGTLGAIQVLVTGAIMGCYHGIIGMHYSVLYAVTSMVLFGVLSIIFIAGGRSLTPPLIAHALVHFLGDPALMQGILEGVRAMSGAG